jgi:ribosome modulation factor
MGGKELSTFLSIVPLSLTRVSATFRLLHLSRVPRSPHRDTAEFREGWCDALNGHSKRDCPYKSPLRESRWEDGFDAALAVRAKRARFVREWLVSRKEKRGRPSNLTVSYTRPDLATRTPW